MGLQKSGQPCDIAIMEKPLDRLAQILDLLGPGLSLELNASIFPIFFDGDIGKESSEIEARRFAEKNNCCFVSDGKTAKFGRAYNKDDGQ